MPGETAAEDEKLAHKPIQQRQADQRERGDDEQGRQAGHALGQAAVGGNLVGSVTFVHEAKQEQKRADGDALVQGLVDRAVQARNREAKDAQNAKAERADGGKRHQPLHILLHQRHQRAVKNADHRQGDHPRRHLAGLGREETEIEAQDGIEAELARDHHGHRGGRFAEYVPQPAMQGKDRDLDGKGDQKC